MFDTKENNVARALAEARRKTEVSDEAFKIVETILAGFSMATIMGILTKDKTLTSELIAEAAVKGAEAIDKLVDEEVDAALEEEDDEDDGMAGAPVQPSPTPDRPRLWGTASGVPMAGCDCPYCAAERKRQDDEEKRNKEQDALFNAMRTPIRPFNPFDAPRPYYEGY